MHTMVSSNHSSVPFDMIFGDEALTPNYPKESEEIEEIAEMTEMESPEKSVENME